MKERLKSPIFLIFFITSKCNSKCNHCFYWKNLNKNVKELTLEEIKKLSKEFNKIPEMALSGGEPFLREDIVEIYRVININNKPKFFTIPTNGLLPEKIYNKVKEMLECNFNTVLSINLSLDGTKDIHDEIRGVRGNYEKVIETYNKLSLLKNDYKNLIIKITTTITNKNIKNISKLIEDVKEKMPKIDFHNFEIARGDIKNKDYKPPSIEELSEIKELLYRTWESYEFYGKKNKLKSRIASKIKKFVFETYLRIIKEKKQVIPCYAYKTSVVIDEKGDLYFCELLPSIGNIKKNSLKEILQSESADKQIKFIKNKGCYCTHSCFQQKNIILNYRLFPKLFSYIIK